MLLTIDVGNTTIGIGIFYNVGAHCSVPLQIRKIPTRKPASTKWYLSEFKKILNTKKIDDIIISSVVPDTTNVLKIIFKRNFEIKPIVLGEDLIVPIKNLYINPKQVGQDRLVNAYSAYKKFGGGLIIIDFGTAITFDIVSNKGDYKGGLITPGISTSLNALHEKTALLPKIQMKAIRVIIGRDTVTSMRSGILHGFGALCDGLVKTICRKAGRRYKVILTGGDATLMSGYCGYNTIQPNLTLEGLRLIYEYYVGAHTCRRGGS